MFQKAQISIFIIVGILLLLVVSGVLLLRSNTELPSLEPIVETPAITPLEQFVEQCIAQTTSQALLLMGSQGGYITVPDEIEQNPSRYVSIHPDRFLKTPYWSFGRTLLIPQIEVIEEQMGEYISENIQSCLQDFQVISDFVEVESITEPLARVIINQNDLFVELDYTIRFIGDTQTQERISFGYRETVALKEMIEMGQLLVEDFIQTEYFELFTINFMAFDEAHIPMSNMDFSCTQKRWYMDDIQERLQTLLYYNIPSIQVRGAERFEYEADPSVYAQFRQVQPDDFINNPQLAQNAPSDSYQYHHMYVESSATPRLQQGDFEIGFTYLPSFGLDIHARPSQNGVLQSSSGVGPQDFLRFFCIQVYHFTYDVEYPVMITLTQENALKSGLPFQLRFAVPVQIQYNLPNKDATQQALSLATPSNSEICEFTRAEEIQVRVNDAVTGEFLSDAQVEYHCVQFNCPLGETSFEDGIQVLRTNLPQGCAGGSLFVQKEGYLPERLFILESNTDFQVDLVPTVDVPFRVMFGEKDDVLAWSQLTPRMQASVEIRDQFSDYTTHSSYVLDWMRLQQAGDSVELRDIFAGELQPTLTLPRVRSIYNVTVLVYEENLLVGGYIGQVDIHPDDLQSRLSIHAVNFGRMTGSIEESLENLLYLQNETNQQRYSSTHGFLWQ